VRSARYKLIYNVTPKIVYAPVDSTGNPSWKEMVAAHESQTLATEFTNLYFTTPRPVYELYDLEQDPNELHNLAADHALAGTVQGLKEALQEKMIVDFDYLPLPLAGRPKKNAAQIAAAQGKTKADRNQMFDRLDTNHDGKLSFDEFAASRNRDEAAGWFKARDRDGDGFLSREEYTAASVANPPTKGR
jgi:hypothetical protein